MDKTINAMSVTTAPDGESRRAAPVGESPPTEEAPAQRFLSVAPSGDPIDTDIDTELRAIEAHFRPRPLVLLVQDGRCPFGVMCQLVYNELRADLLAHLERGIKPIVVLHSQGGFAKPAYQLARFLRRHCTGYDVIVPGVAKSAATLFALGADQIILGNDAELGPLDAQVSDPEREESMSALEVVQCLERLNREAIQAVDYHMVHWTHRCGKKLETLLPIGTRFVAQLMQPLFEKVDAVHFTSMARVLRVAQDYAESLLVEGYGKRAATDVASQLTEAYSEHDFVIDAPEAERIGLRVQSPHDTIVANTDRLSLVIGNKSLIGRLQTHVRASDNSSGETRRQQRSVCRTRDSGCQVQ